MAGIDRRLRGALRAAETGDLQAMIEVAHLYRRSGDAEEARNWIRRALDTFHRDLPNQLQAMHHQERQKYLDAGGCPVCRGEGSFIFKGQRRRCPNEVGKLCTIPKRKKLGTLRDALAKIREVPGAREFEAELRALLGEDVLEQIQTPAHLVERTLTRVR